MENFKTDVPSVGVDVGTANICVCRRLEDGTFSVRHHRNMLYEMEESDEAENLLSRSDYLYVKSDKHYYIVGDDALKLVNAIGQGEIIRPMQDGLLNPNLKRAQNLMNYILKAVLGIPIETGEHLRFSVPANPIDKPEVNNIFHSMVLTEFFKKLGYAPKPINEALANLYAEAPSMEVEGEGSYPLTGLSISCGAGMANVCLGVRGMPVVEFSMTKSGDHIDKQVALVTGERSSRVIRIKEKMLDLGEENTEDRVLQALSIYYDEFIGRILKLMGKEFVNRKVTLDGAIDLVFCGGTAMPQNFVERAKKIIPTLELPFTIKDVKLARSPFYSVAQGACLAAESDSQKADAKES